MTRAPRWDRERTLAVVLTVLAGAAALCLILAAPAEAAERAVAAKAAPPLPPPRALPMPMPAPAPVPAPAAADPAARWALVVVDLAPLRAGPHDAGPAAAQLVQGELVELREARLDFVQVWDHRRERGGFVRASQLREVSLAPAAAPGLLAQLRLLRDRPGLEPLGLGVAAAYLRAAPAGTIDAEPFDALGTMADRLAQRATGARADDAALATQLEAAAAMGLGFESVETAQGVRLCYDGDAFRHVLALAPTPEQAARAVLALTRHACVPDSWAPSRRAAWDQGRAALLDRVPETELAPYLRNRLRVRRAGVWAAIAFEESRRAALAEGPARETALQAMQRAGTRALESLAAVDRHELADDDLTSYADAAMRVGASRWAAEPPLATAVAASPAGASRGLRIALVAGQPGEQCVLLLDGTHDTRAPLARRCTWGTVWAASARSDARQQALALAVQPLAAWRELWVFRRVEADGAGMAAHWDVQVLPPSTDEPGVGYVEFAGWVPGGRELLVAREVRAAGRPLRRFELLRLDTLETERWADTPSSLTPFYRWQEPAWKRATVSLR